MAKDDPVQSVLEGAVNNGERKAYGRKQGVDLTLEKKSYPLRHGGVKWKVLAYNGDGSVKEEKTGLKAHAADQLFERLIHLHNLDEDSE